MTLLDWPDLPDDERACLRRLTREGLADAASVATALGLPEPDARAALDRLVARGAARVEDGRYAASPGTRRTRGSGLADLLGRLADEG